MDSQLPTEVLTRIGRCGVVAVLVIDAVDDAVPVARALVEGGIDVMELTLRTESALDALSAIRAEVPEMLPGIGTILQPEQVRQVRRAGAAFGVAPGLNRRVVSAAQEVDLPFSPGIVTPSDLEAALELGCRDVKFFPAEPAGGLPYLASLAAPYRHLGVRFLPLGGLRPDHIGAYLADPLILAIGGSWLAPRAMIQAGDWQGIRQRATEARNAVDRVDRPENRPYG